MNNIETNPEFASEIVLSIPYCYYLHQRGELGEVVVCNGMTPFYYFADKVVEEFEYRSFDNEVALKDIPNKWLHNSEAGGGRNGVIDYSQWICPPYREHFKNNLFDDLKPYVIVNNIFNLEPNGEVARFFDLQNLYDMFTYLGEVGYNVIYKRPNNKEFVIDQNEYHTLNSEVQLTGEIEGVGIVDDWELCDYFENVTNLNKLWKETKLDYSTLNLNVFAEAEGFISIHGAGVQLCACFGKPVIIYTNIGKGLRPGYVENEDSYLKMLSRAEIYHIKDDMKYWDENGGRNYIEIMEKIKQVFNNVK